MKKLLLMMILLTLNMHAQCIMNTNSDDSTSVTIDGKYYAWSDLSSRQKHYCLQDIMLKEENKGFQTEDVFGLIVIIILSMYFILLIIYANDFMKEKEKEKEKIIIQQGNTGDKNLFLATLIDKYAEFKGIAKRKEYWTFIIISAIIFIIALFISPLLSQIVAVIFLLPQIAVSVRRIHDIGLSGWWGWLFIPLGLPMLIVGLIGSKEKNIVTNIKKTVKKATADIMSKPKPKPKDMNEVADALLKFEKLLKTGAISQKEFDDAKKDLLNTK